MASKKRRKKGTRKAKGHIPDSVIAGFARKVKRNPRVAAIYRKVLG